MKRSTIDDGIDWAIDSCDRLHVSLPSFARWTPEEWTARESQTEFMRAVAMGWDVTDYGTGDFDHTGCVLLTIRNGQPDRPETGRVYCEKYLIMKQGQLLPCHFHYFKSEDIINRTGGILRVQVWNSTPSFDGYRKDFKGDVHVMIDGLPITVAAGGHVDIKPGNSIYITPYLYHEFEAVGDDLIIGEVSRCNDDAHDNHFNPPCNLQKIEEDQTARHQLCGGYQQ